MAQQHTLQDDEMASGATEQQLKRTLELPDHIDQKVIIDWVLRRLNRKNEEIVKWSNYNDKRICWISRMKSVNTNMKIVFGNELRIVTFHRNRLVNSKKLINEELKIKTMDYFDQPVKFNNICEKMEFILSTIFYLNDEIPFHTALFKDKSTNCNKIRPIRKVLCAASSKLMMFMKKILLSNDDDLSLFQFAPIIGAEQKEWKVDDNKLSELVERFMTKEGSEELRKVLDNPESLTEMKKEMPIPLEIFEMQNELEIDKLLDKLGIQDLLEPDKATLSNFTKQNLLLGDVKHYAHICMTPNEVTADAVSMFFTKEGGSLNQIKDISIWKKVKNKSLWLLYCKKRHTILFIGIMNEDK
ncbi:uncharacterized protein LOC114930271 isoform X2 [Nylanderia fulva]|uniref:uncharacterized protein LOC114930271 isoform X2 n=1 Tax=Nylanderia fulva TaxID=613905 RepID=UPI0010FB8D77|nr:uncharacterized protein LOC114930271 isoform X2 [Nylanderia fulva]